MHLAKGAEPMGGALLAHVDRRQEALPKRLRPHPRGVRGEAQDADHRDEGGAGGTEAAEGGGGAANAGNGEGEKERWEGKDEKE